MNEYKDKLKKDGVCVLKNIYSKNINAFTAIFKKLENSSYDILKTAKSKKINYVTYYDKEIIYKKNLYKGKLLSVLELNKGRYDIYLNNNNIILDNKINELLSDFIKKNYRVNWGILTSNIESGDGDWHRDTVNIDGDSNNDGSYNDYNMVHNMNPFYFTILIPLVPLNKKNGSTEFIKGSHKLSFDEINNKEHLQFDTNLGDAIVFDGRIFHRGKKNMSYKPRPMIYIIVYRSWYNDSY